MTRRETATRWGLALMLVTLSLLLMPELHLRENALDLLPDGAVRGDVQKLQQVGLVDRLFITLTAAREPYPTPAAARAALRRSVTRLAEQLDRSERISQVTAGFSAGQQAKLLAALQPYLPVLFSEADRALLAQIVSRPELERRLHRAFLLLNSPEGLLMASRIQRDPLGFSAMFGAKLDYLRSEFSMQLADGLLLSPDSRSCLILARSAGPLTDSDHGIRLQSELEEYFRTSLEPGVDWRIIGTLPHTLANHNAVKRDLRWLLPIATLGLAVFLTVSLKSFRAIPVLIVPFLAAPAAIGLTHWYYGSISGLALGFGIVLLGIGVDFAIHLYLALTRELGSSTSIVRRLSRPILFASLTTVSVFLVLTLSAVSSHRQMAVLALFGIILAVGFTVLVVPAIAAGRASGVTQPRLEGSGSINGSGTLDWLTLSAWLILLAAGMAAWPGIRYNGDLQLLDAPNPAVEADEEYFRQTWGDSGERLFVISSGTTLTEAVTNNDQVFRLLREQGGGAFQSLGAVLPGPAQQQRNLERWRAFWEDRLVRFRADFNEAARRYGFSEQAFRPFLQELERQPGWLDPERFLEPPLRELSSMLVHPPSAPAPGEYAVLSTASAEASVLAALRQLDEANEDIEVLANSVWRSEVERLLRHDLRVLSLAAGCCVALLVAVQFRSLAALVAVLAPVVSALAAMALFSRVTGSELNMMHLLMGIMVIGLAVDYGIFMACSLLDGYGTTTRLAVSACAASSLIGFGVLAFASHPALQALGITVLVGIGAAWPTAMLVSPAILRRLSR